MSKKHVFKKHMFKQHIHAMSAYTPPLEGRDPASHILLDFNERTIPVSETVAKALVDYIQSGRLQTYPTYGDVVKKIADYAAVPAEQVMISNGSDQGIDLVFRAACSEGDEVIIPAPSFAIYTQCARVEHTRIICPHYSKEKGYPLVEVMAAISDRTRLIVVSNPNNPSGTAISREDIVVLAKAAPEAVILVDECYFEYCGISVADMVGQYPNLIVTRTFSKTWGLPSLRLGYLIADQQNILALLNVRGPYDVNQLAIVAIDAALKDHAWVDSYVDEVMSQSKPLLEAFLDEQGIEYWPSQANFVWAFPERPLELEQVLRDAGLLVRPKADEGGEVGLRITVGTLSQTQRCIDVLRKFLSGTVP